VFYGEQSSVCKSSTGLSGWNYGVTLRSCATEQNF